METEQELAKKTPLAVTLKDECPLGYIYFIGKLENIKDEAWRPQKKDTE